MIYDPIFWMPVIGVLSQKNGEQVRLSPFQTNLDFL
jgi:hypothetical protein